MNSEYFVNTGDGYETYTTAEEARAAAWKAIDDWRGYCDPEWPEEVQHVRWGEVYEVAVEIESRSEDGREYCDYDLEPCALDRCESLAQQLSDAKAWAEFINVRNQKEREVVAWARATLTALNTGDIHSGNPLHLKLREVIVALNDADEQTRTAGEGCDE